METTQAEAGESKTAASSDADTPQIDLEAVTLDQLDELMTKGSAEVPVKSGGGDNESQESAVSTAQEAEPPEAGDKPPTSDEADSQQDGAQVTEKPEAEGAAAAAQAEADKLKAEGESAAPKTGEEHGDDDVPRIQRPRLKDPIDQQIAAIYKHSKDTGTPITWAEAERRVKGEPASPAKEEPETPTIAAVVSTLETEVADLKSKLDAAGGDEALFTKEIAKWTQELAEKTADLKLAKRDLADEQALAREAAEEADTKWKTTLAASRTRVIELYPDVADDATPLGKAVSEEIVAMRDPSHPDHNLLFTGSAPETITRRVAERLGIQPVAKAATPQPAKKPAPPVKLTKVEPASGAKTAASKGKTPEDVKKSVEYLKTEGSLEELDAAFGAGDQSKLLQRIA